MQYQSRSKRHRSLNLISQKMSEKEVTLFFNYKGTPFSDIFDTSKTEQAKTFPLFSGKPHSIQDDMGGHDVAISCSLTTNHKTGFG